MNKLILLEIWRKAQTQPRVMRKLKIFLIVGVLGCVLTASLVIWAGISALSFVVGKSRDLMQSPQVSAHVEKMQDLPVHAVTFQPVECWQRALSLLAVEPWVLQSALTNLQNLKASCLGSPASSDSMNNSPTNKEN
ncbi:MAG: hypothetical protein ACK5P7_05335 [Bdellovibrio sp.]|jgi:hypothetical protein